MSRIAICSSIYPIEERFALEFAQSVAHALARLGDTGVVLAIQDDTHLTAMRNHWPSDIEIVRATGSPNLTPAEMRALMLRTAAETDAEILVFADYDDRLNPETLERHAAALTEAEISYGDLALIDSDGNQLGMNFFDNCFVPAFVVGPEVLHKRNFMGFGNTAIRRRILSEKVCRIPKDVIAADWWLYTCLLAEGHRARRTDRPVGEYRLHAASTVGATQPNSVRALIKNAEIVASHFRHLPASIRPVDSMHAVERLVDRLRSCPNWAEDAARGGSCANGVWFEEILRLSAV